MSKRSEWRVSLFSWQNTSDSLTPLAFDILLTFSTVKGWIQVRRKSSDTLYHALDSDSLCVCVCVCACFLPGTTLTSTACLPSVIRIWMPIWLNRPAFTPVSSTCSVPSMRSTLTSASTAKRWGSLNTLYHRSPAAVVSWLQLTFSHIKNSYNPHFYTNKR